MEDFKNSILIPENLPEALPEDFSGLNKRYLKIIFIRIAFFALVLAGGIISLLILSEEKPPVLILIAMISGIVLLISFISVISALGFPKKGYLLRERDISYKTGLIYFKQISVPFNRVQHVEVSQGVLGKLFNLSSVKVYTAGGNASDLSIPGLRTRDAQKIKVFISEKISQND
jgi:membrane protein YdbS with pleckstrin-like domain